jgi:predicted N-formylglutamate amidohydrolase
VIRQDLIADDSGQRMWGARLARLLPQAYRELASTGSLGSE